MSKTPYHFLALEGDGIGPEIMRATLAVLEAVQPLPLHAAELLTKLAQRASSAGKVDELGRIYDAKDHSAGA